MKEATGELSMTAVAIVAIAAIAVLVSTLIMPRIRATIDRNTKCSQSFACQSNDDGTATCKYIDQDTNEVADETVICPDDTK